MKLTAVDITHRKIAHSFRGYRVSDVDDLLREVGVELENAARDRARMEQQLESAHAEIARYRDMEETLNNAILLAQRTADELRANAGREADLIIAEAQQKGRELAESGLRERQDLLNDIRHLQEHRDALSDVLRSAGRDLLEWLDRRRWPDVIAVSADAVTGEPGAVLAGDDAHLEPVASEAGEADAEPDRAVAGGR